MSAELTLAGPRPLRGTMRVPGEKGISHRALLVAALADGRTRLRGLAPGDDVARTAAALEQLGVGVKGGTDGSDCTVARRRRRRPARSRRRRRLRELGHDAAHARRPGGGSAVPHRAHRRRVAARPADGTGRRTAADPRRVGRRARRRTAGAPGDPRRRARRWPRRAAGGERPGEDGGAPRRAPGRGQLRDRGAGTESRPHRAHAGRARRRDRTGRRPHPAGARQRARGAGVRARRPRGPVVGRVLRGGGVRHARVAAHDRGRLPEPDPARVRRRCSGPWAPASRSRPRRSAWASPSGPSPPRRGR